mgnify:CR=1 FL=1
MITLILGGQRSGKSRFALDEARKYKGKKAFIATSERIDEEMVERIVLLKRRLAAFIDEYAKSRNLTFSEALNEVLEEYLNLKGAAA